MGVCTCVCVSVGGGGNIWCTELIEGVGDM